MRDFIIQQSGVTHDVFDGEIVALNLAEGKYYSMEGCSSFIWQALDHNFGTLAIINQLEGIQNEALQDVRAQVISFLNLLEKEGLIYEVTTNANNEPDLRLVTLPGVYSTPELQIFTDMQEVIALDPVHDVSEKGWPIKINGPGK